MPTLLEKPKIDRLRDGETRIVMENIDWPMYETLCDRLAEQHLHLTYDCGVLEIMSPSSRHERYKNFSGYFVEDLLMELDDIENYEAYCETTWKRANVEKGLEADLCYYFDPVKLATLQGRLPDRSDDPLPDLAIEIDVSRSAVNKMAVYAALGFAEVWSTDGEVASIEQLGADGIYRPGETSLFLPVRPEDWLQWLWQSEVTNPKEWRRNFRAWCRDGLRNRAT
jgi:Uma2 family endonuclease